MQKIGEVLEFLDRLGRTEKLVLVEGVKDKRALEAFGVGNVYCLNRGPLYKIVEDVAASSSKAIILTDLDSEGKRLYGRLKTQLQNLGVEVDNYFREFLFRKTKIRQIEGLCSLRPANPCLAVTAESPVFVDMEDCQKALALVAFDH